MASWLRGGAGSLPTGDLSRNRGIGFAEHNHYSVPTSTSTLCSFMIGIIPSWNLRYKSPD